MLLGFSLNFSPQFAVPDLLLLLSFLSFLVFLKALFGIEVVPLESIDSFLRCLPLPSQTVHCYFAEHHAPFLLPLLAQLPLLALSLKTELQVSLDSPLFDPTPHHHRVAFNRFRQHLIRG